jgi:hypothetical protein
MAWLHEHIEDCEKMLGIGYGYVHIWLDERAKDFPVEEYGGHHRQFRHNKRGIERVKNRFGKMAALAAKIHIVRDLMGWVRNYTLKELRIVAHKIIPE